MNTDFQRISRLPPYVFNVIGEMRQEARARGEDIIDLSMGNPDQPTPEHIVKKLAETAERGDTHRYSQSKGIPRLRRMANWYKDRYDVDLDQTLKSSPPSGRKAWHTWPGHFISGRHGIGAQSGIRFTLMVL